MRALMSLAFLLLVAGCSEQNTEFVDPVRLYKNGDLKACDSTYTLTPKPADIVVMLEKSDVAVLLNWVHKKFPEQQHEFATGGIIFIHELSNPKNSPDALFTYLFLKKDGDKPYCYNGGINGTIPTNQQFLEKYKKN